MQLVISRESVPHKLTLNLGAKMSDVQYFAFCRANPDIRFERTSQGEIVIVPPAGLESDNRNADVTGQLITWAKRDGRGRAFGPSAEFILPTGAALSPDGAWVSKARLATISKELLKKFPPLSPEFVIEVRSPSDRLKALQEKMKQ